MEVTKVDDFVSHAAIGGHQAIDMGISDSAEFFQILSSTLYSDQPLAVIREVLCNAWDSHKDAGCTDKSIIVTLDGQKLTIRDFGKGIHHNLIGPIYGVYGGSTKKNDGKQTGGFGLGCKAPFAYTDSFEVTSSHEGNRWIYRMSKSSAEVGGKPSIIPMAGPFKDDKSGITVSINLKKPSDQRIFHDIILRIVRNGEMNVEYNGAKLPVIEFSKATNDYLIYNQPLTKDLNRLMVRYGDVIYPIPAHEQYTEEMKYATKLIENLSRFHQQYLVLMAPPHSISITPSRESISMQAHTIQTLKKLFKNFSEKVKAPMNEDCFIALKEQIDIVAKSEDISPLFVPGSNLCYNKSNLVGKSAEVWDTKSMARLYMRGHYPDEAGFRQRDTLARAQALIQEGKVDRGLMQQWVKAYMEKPTPIVLGQPIPTSWVTRYIVAPMVLKLKELELPTERFTVLTKTRRSGGVPTEAMNYVPASIQYQMPFVRKIVILSHTNKIQSDWEARKRVGNFPGMSNGDSVIDLEDMFLYSYPHNVKWHDKLVKAFTDMGFMVIDLTVRHSWEAADVVKVPVKKEIVKREGLISMKNLNRRSLNAVKSMTNPVLITDPRVIIKLDMIRVRGIYEAQIPDYDDDNLEKAIYRLYGTRIGIAVNSVQQKAWEKKLKTPTLTEYLVRSICKAVERNKNIAQIGQNTLDAFFRTTKEGDKAQQKFKRWLALPMNRHLVPQERNLTKIEDDQYTLWRHLQKLSVGPRGSAAVFNPVHALTEKTDTPVDFTTLREHYHKVVDNTALDLIDLVQLRAAMLKAKDHPDYKKALSLYDLAMKGKK